MPRHARLQVSGLPMHIIQRGNNRQACFFAEEDYRFFLDHLAQLAKRFRVSVHAYVLMTNHFHLLIGKSRLGSADCSPIQGEEATALKR